MRLDLQVFENCKIHSVFAGEGTFAARVKKCYRVRLTGTATREANRKEQAFLLLNAAGSSSCLTVAEPN
jgi:hypothetical protein